MKTLIANWKMNPQTSDESRELFEFTVSESLKNQGLRTVICPPFVYLKELSNFLKTLNHNLENIALGAQDIFYEPNGAFTGEISPEMLKNLGVSYVLIGHSDRRYTIGESDEVINKKIRATLLAGLVPILLVGERDGENREEILKKQLTIDLANIPNSDIEKILFTYEPVWAISTNPGARPDNPEKTIEAIKLIQNILFENHSSAGDIKIENYFYGGSINEKNVVDFLGHPEISGAVIGGASLKKEVFGKIIELTSHLK
jgi:triosephosphate isomerase (TIM)